LIFDYKSALDWSILAIMIVSTVGASVIGGPGGGAGVFMWMRSIAGAAKIASFVAKSTKLLKTVTKSVHWVHKTQQYKRALKIAEKAPAVIRVTKPAKSVGFFKRVRKTTKTTKTTINRIKRGYAIFSGIDMLHVTKEDVEDYRAYITRRTTVWGSRFEAKYSDDLSRMINMGADIFEFADDGVVDKIRNIMNNDVGNEDRISRVLSEKYSRDVTVTGFKKLNLVKKLSGIAVKVSLFFTKALFGLGDILTKKDFIIKNGG
jgi:hypothetical protein